MEEPAVATAEDAARGLTDRERQVMTRCLTGLAVLGSGSLLGIASSLYLVGSYPLLLIALSPIGRHLILVAPFVNPVAFVIVGTARRLLFYMLSFHLGRALGDSGIGWLEARWPFASRGIRWLQKWFDVARYPVLLLFSGPTVSTIAGMSDIPSRVFAALVATGLVFRMLIILVVAQSLIEPLRIALDWIDAYKRPGTLLIVLCILVYELFRRRRARLARALSAQQSAEADHSLT